MEWLRHIHEPTGAVGEPLLIVEDQPDSFSNPQCGDGQIIFAQAKRGNPDQEGDNSTHDRGTQQPEDKREIQPEDLMDILGIDTGGHGGGDHGGSIGADTEKSCDTNVEETCVTPLNVEAEAEDGIDTRHDCQRNNIGQNTAEFHGFVYSFPKIPWGRTSRMIIIIIKATANL